MIDSLYQAPTPEELEILDRFIPRNREGLRIYKDTNNPSGIIKQFEVHAVCYLINEDGHLGIMFCDNHGNGYNTIFGLMLARFNDDNKNISIDYETNKISLSDACGNVIIQSDIDPKLLVRLSETNIKIEEVCPELTNPEAIRKIINSDGLKSILDKHMPVVSMEAKEISAAPSKLDSTGGNVDSTVDFKPDGK